MAIQNNVVRSSTVLTCIKNPNHLGKSNDVTITWAPSHTGIYSNEKADILDKSGSAHNCLGFEPFIRTPYVDVRAAVSDWSNKRWKPSWAERKDCLKRKENEEWASPRFTQRLLCLESLQVLTCHSNLQKHRNTIGLEVSTTCPKRNLEEETRNHNVGECVFYQNFERKVLEKKKT